MGKFWVGFKKVLLWLYKHWVIMLPAFCLFGAVVLPHKPIAPVFTGAFAMGFVWSSYNAWRRYLSNRGSDGIFNK